LIKGVAVAEGGDAGTSGVAMAEGRVEGAAKGVSVAEGREELGRGADEARATTGAGLADGRGEGGGVEAAWGGVDGAGRAVVTSSCGMGAGAGMSSVPHSASMSSVGGAMDGIGARPLTRSLSDRLSVIAL